MPWYKLELKGGKGHTNHEIEYVWSDLKWSAEEKKAQWDSWANEFGYERMYDGHITYVKRLPAKECNQQIEMYRREIEEANRMITILCQTQDRLIGGE